MSVRIARLGPSIFSAFVLAGAALPAVGQANLNVKLELDPTVAFQNTAVSMQAIGNQRVLLPTGPVTGTAADGSTATVNDLQQHSRNWSDIMTSTDCDYTLSGPSGYMRGGGFTCRADQDPAPNKNRIFIAWSFIGTVDGSETAEIGGYTVAATVRAKAAFYFPALTGGVGDNNSKLYYFPLATGFDVKSFYIIPLVIPPLPPPFGLGT